MLDYDQLAADYARHRRVHPEVLRQLLHSGLSRTATVLEVGCGTGNYIGALAEALACVCRGIDPSVEMLAQAKERASAVQFGQGRAEALDFAAGSFDLVFSVDVIHHVRDRPAYFGEAYRALKPGGRLCTVTDSEEIIRHRQPLSVYFPETVVVDLARYPPIAELRRGMIQAGFCALDEISVEFASSVNDVAPYRARAFSCLQLIPDDAFRKGIDRMESDLRAGSIRTVSRYLMLWGSK